MLSIRLEADLEKRLEKLAKKTGRTKAYYVREALQEHLEHLEDIYLALDRIEKPARRWTLEELENNKDVASGVG